MDMLEERLAFGKRRADRRVILSALDLTGVEIAEAIGTSNARVTMTVSSGANLQPDQAEALAELARTRIIALFTKPGGSAR